MERTGDQPDSPPNAQQVTGLLISAAQGDLLASEELLPLVYAELRALAASNLRREQHAGSHNTLEPTGLVHEAYMRLVAHQDQHWNGKAHFFGAAALAMRRILVDRARARNTEKRGVGRRRVQLGEDAIACDPTTAADPDTESAQLLAIDSALDRLKLLDDRAAQVVMLRYFAGLSIEQTAMSLSTSPATVKKAWTFARAWLSREVRLDAGNSEP